MKKIMLLIMLLSVTLLLACNSEEQPVNDEEIIPDEPGDNDVDDEPVDDDADNDVDDEPVDNDVDDEPVDDDVDDEENGQQETFNAIESASTNFQDNTFTYEITVNKPTPCHEVSVAAEVSEDNVLELGVMIIPSEEICAQVITPETVTGTIEVDEEPQDTLVFLI